MVVQGGHPPPGPNGPWKKEDIELSPDVPEIGTRAYISVGYVPQGPNNDQCPGGYEMALISKDTPRKTCIMSKAVGYTIATPLILPGSTAPEKTQTEGTINQLLGYLTVNTIVILLAAIAVVLLVFNAVNPGEASSSLTAANTTTNTSQEGGHKLRQSKGKRKGRSSRRR